MYYMTSKYIQRQKDVIFRGKQRLFVFVTRWTTTLSSQVNLPHVINFGASCGANLVTQHQDLWGNKTVELRRVVSTCHEARCVMI